MQQICVAILYWTHNEMGLGIPQVGNSGFSLVIPSTVLTIKNTGGLS